MVDKLTDIELHTLTTRVMNTSVKELQRDLHNNAFSEKERPYIERYLAQTIQEERNVPIKLYHRRKAPNGKMFKAYEVPVLESKGWVDSPSKIKKDARDKCIDVLNSIYTFWCKEYKWILGVILSAITLYLAYLKLTT
jgi:hypothetical protein